MKRDKYGFPDKKWTKNEKWQLKMDMYGLMFLLIISILWGAIGWRNYKEALKEKTQLQDLLSNMFRTIE